MIPGKNGKNTIQGLQKHGQGFTIYIEEGIAHFHPVSPKATPKLQ